MLNFYAVLLGGFGYKIANELGITAMIYSFEKAFVADRDSTDANAGTVYSRITQDAMIWAVMGLCLYADLRPIAEAYFWAITENAPMWFQNSFAGMIEAGKYHFEISEW